jgi:hypothetical protein
MFTAGIVGCPGTDGVPADSDSDAIAMVTFTLDGGVFSVEARPGATVRNVSQALDALSVGSQDEALNISPNGEWLVLETDRFDPACAESSCLAVVTGDLSSGAAVRTNNNVVRADAPGTDAFSAISNDGNLIVYPGSQGPHESDLFAVRRISGDDWNAPELLTGDSAFEFNAQPAISDDGGTVVFDCGPIEFGQEGTNICEVSTDGNGLRIVRQFDDPPPGIIGGVALHHSDFAPDGSIVFEGDWDGEQIWRLAPNAAPTSVGGVNNDNSPCVLPDGRVASLTFGDDGNHQIKVMDADGGGSFVLFSGEDVVDIGIGCGGTR